MRGKCLFDMSDLDINRVYYSINIYKYRFLDNLSQDYVNRFVLFVNKDNFEFIRNKYPQFTYLVSPEQTFIYKIPLIGKFYALIRHRNAINKSGCDVFFSASNYDFNNILGLRIRKVVVIHDLKSIYERKGHWDYLFHKIKASFYYKRIIKSSDIIIPISSYTKNRIEDVFSKSNFADKLKVIYNCVPLVENVSPLPIDTSRSFLLYVNTLIPTKNFITLLNAFNISRYKNDLNLVVVGNITDYWKYEIEPLIERYHLEKKIQLYSDVTDEELKYLYSKASLFISPSLNEGFGYTPIEAAMNNCPVICSKCEALPDTTQGKVQYYENPKDEKELANKIDSLISLPPSKEELCDIASFFKEIYSPQSQVEQILEQLFPIK